MMRNPQVNGMLRTAASLYINNGVSMHAPAILEFRVSRNRRAPQRLRCMNQPVAKVVPDSQPNKQLALVQ